MRTNATLIICVLFLFSCQATLISPSRVVTSEDEISPTDSNKDLLEKEKEEPLYARPDGRGPNPTTRSRREPY